MGEGNKDVLMSIEKSNFLLCSHYLILLRKRKKTYFKRTSLNTTIYHEPFFRRIFCVEKEGR